MKLNKSIAIVWLVLTILPFLYIPFFMTLMIGDSNLTTEEYRDQFDNIFKYHASMIFWLWGLTAAYIIYIFKTAYVPSDKKALWAVVIFCANMFSMPFFWYYYIWKPSISLNESPDKENNIDKKPFIIGAIIFSLIPFSILFVQYKTGNSYNYLSDKLPLTSELTDKSIVLNNLSIKKSQRVHGATRLNNIMRLYFFDSSIAFNPKEPYSMLYKSFEVKKEDIHSCSKQCGGGTEYILILEKFETQISMEGVPELIDWCWDNKIPMLPAKNRREWLYNGDKLPSNEVFIEQLSNHENYAYQTKRSCQGY